MIVAAVFACLFGYCVCRFMGWGEPAPRLDEMIRDAAETVIAEDLEEHARAQELARWNRIPTERT